MASYDQDDLEKVTDLLDEIAFYLQLDGANHWKYGAYSGASDTLESKDPEILEDPESVDGIGESIGDEIQTILDTGESPKLKGLKDDHADLSEIMRVEGIGPKTAMKFYEELGIETLDELEEAAKNEQLQTLNRVGSKTEENVFHEIEQVRLGADKRIDYDQVESYWEGLEARLLALADKDGNDIGRIRPAGSFRREEDTVGDLDVIVEARRPHIIFNNLEDWDLCDDVLGSGSTKMSFRVDSLQIDVRVVPTNEYGACIQYFTGSKDHNVALRSYARSQGYTINEYGIFELTEEGEKGDKVGGAREEEIYQVLGLPMPDPTERTEEWVEERI